MNESADMKDEDGKCIRCGDKAKWRGARPGDHEHPQLWYWYCGGDDCVKKPLRDRGQRT
jgi:hypothetical protein